MDITKPKTKNQKPKSGNRKAFALIELLISVGIVSLLIALFITNFDRATAANRLANDAELVKAKIEQARLLAGSTQISDEPAGSSGDSNYDPAGYYGVFMPNTDTTNGLGELMIVRVAYPLPSSFHSGDCPAGAIPIGGPTITLEVCPVETFYLDKQVKYRFGYSERIIAFRVPTQESLTIIKGVPPRWIEWVAQGRQNFTLILTKTGKRATLTVEPSGGVNVSYR